MTKNKEGPQSLLVRCYFGIHSWGAYLSRSIEALHQAIWLGLLNREQLAELTEWRYRQWSEYTEPGYNLSGLDGWEKGTLYKYFGACESVLVGAAGGGREVIALSQRGLEVGAFECSAFFAEGGNKILEAARVEPRIEVAHPDHVPESFGTYDGFIMGWGGYMHILGRARRIAFLAECRKHLNDRSPILLSFFTRSADDRKHQWTRRIANFIRFFRPEAEPVETGDLLEETLNHRFTENEIRSELEGAGFEILLYAETPYGHAVGRLAGEPAD